MNPQIILNPLSKEEVSFNLLLENYGIVKSETDGSIFLQNQYNKNELLTFEKEKVCNLIQNLFYQKFGKIISKNSVNNLWSLIKAIAENCEDYQPIATLIFQTKDNNIYYDFGSEKNIIKISKRGVMQIKRETSRILFINNNIKNKKIYLPKKNIQGNEYLRIIRNLFNLDNSQILLFAVYIVTLFLPKLNHPLLILQGEQGAAKSTTLRMISRIINPHCGDLNTMPTDIDDLATILHNQYFSAFDNISYISKAFADLLCMTVTGGFYSKRKKYTDNQLSVSNIHKPVALNGLNLNISFGDLMDRAVFIELKRIDVQERLTEVEVWDKFYNYLPKLLGGAFTILSSALSMINNVVIKSLPRLADFSKYGYCIAESIKKGYGDKFLQQYNHNISCSRKAVIMNNPLLSSINYFMDDKDEWRGSMTELLKELGEVYLNNSVSNYLPSSFPKAANSLSTKLKVLHTDLSAIGISVDIGRGSTRYVYIKKSNNKE